MSSVTPSAAVGDNVRAEMSRRRLSQSAMAARLGISQGAVSARLRGVTPFDINELVDVARILEVSLDRLTDGAAPADDVEVPA